MKTKVTVHEAADARAFAVIDEASGLVENVISANDAFAQHWRGEHPGKLLIEHAAAGPGWSYCDGALLPPESG